MLDEQQKELVEKNHNLIYHTLHKYKLNEEEYYDILAIGLCKAAIKFDPERSKFSTFAVKVMYNEFLQHDRNENANKRKVNKNTLSLNHRMKDPKNESRTCEFGDLLTDGREPFMDVIHMNIPDILTKKELLACKLSYYDYNKTQIGEKMGVTQSYASKLLKSARIKLEKEVVL